MTCSGRRSRCSSPPSRCGTSSPSSRRALADPRSTPTSAKARKVGRRYAELTPIVAGWTSTSGSTDDLAAARELARGRDVRGRGRRARGQLARSERLTRLLAPRDPNDSADALIEIKSGEGGEESALFAGDLLKMYTRYAETRGWKVEVLDTQETDLGGYKSVTAADQGADGWASRTRCRTAC